MIWYVRKFCICITRYNTILGSYLHTVLRIKNIYSSTTVSWHKRECKWNETNRNCSGHYYFLTHRNLQRYITFPCLSKYLAWKWKLHKLQKKTNLWRVREFLIIKKYNDSGYVINDIKKSSSCHISKPNPLPLAATRYCSTNQNEVVFWDTCFGKSFLIFKT